MPISNNTMVCLHAVYQDACENMISKCKIINRYRDTHAYTTIHCIHAST